MDRAQTNQPLSAQAADTLEWVLAPVTSLVPAGKTPPAVLCWSH